MPDAPRQLDRRMLDHAARLAWRGWGHAEPNPMVGCVIGTASGRVLGGGWHRRFGGPHAEVEALGACAASGADPRGATAWVTLEPCSHTGKTGPCTVALADAGVSRVVYAAADPASVSGGGAAWLRSRGIEAELCGVSWRAVDVSAPFRKRVATGLPWVIAKWAQTVDGRVATRTGESQWISNACSRRVVHRTRGRVDAVLTGMGTVRRDDPALTARASRPRRVAARVVVDARAELPVESRLVRTAGEAPVIVLTGEPTREIEARASALRDRGVLVASFGAPGGRVDLPSALRWLSEDRDATSVLVEAGPGLIGAMFDLGLIDEAHVFTGALALGDPGAPGPIAGGAAERLADATRLRLLDVRRVGDDVAAVYRRADGAG